MSIGQDRVRVQFNPSADTVVDQIKIKSAELIDLCDTLLPSDVPGNPTELVRLVRLAQTSFEEAAMWGVKAATFSKP